MIDQLLVYLVLISIPIALYSLYKGYKWIHSRFGDIWAGVYIAGIIYVIKWLDGMV